jgi:hypothetical protein
LSYRMKSSYPADAVGVWDCISKFRVIYPVLYKWGWAMSLVGAARDITHCD